MADPNVSTSRGSSAPTQGMTTNSEGLSTEWTSPSSIPSDYSTGPLLQDVHGASASKSSWDSPIIKYFAITGILAAVCLMLFLVHMYIHFLQQKRERMAALKNPTVPGMISMGKGDSSRSTGGAYGGAAKSSSRQAGFMMKFNR